jgi:hypothetical protein
MHWLDPNALPVVKGRVAQFTINRRGDVDGVLLEDDRQVHVPPHMGAALERLVGVGDAIEARYVKPRGADLFAAVSVSNAAGKTLVDQGPPPKHGPDGHPKAPRKERATKPIDVAGRVRTTLYAPKGEVCGAILDNGAQVRVDPKANADLAPYFARDSEIHVWGEGLKRKGITLVDVHEIAYIRDS